MALISKVQNDYKKIKNNFDVFVRCSNKRIESERSKRIFIKNLKIKKLKIWSV